MLLRALIVWMLLFAFLGAGNAATAAAKPEAEKRVALVIGNARYKSVPLKNPVNDAKDIAAQLRKLGFEVIEKTDVTQKEMNRAIVQFGERLGGKGVGLFYFAGHGVQVAGKNYLLPIDAEIGSEAAVRAESVDADAVLDQLAANPLNVVILDACRNNPFERRFRALGGGLAQMDAPKGTLVAFATAPGKTAADGEGRNGIYTTELLKVLKEPGLKVEDALKRVRINVQAATGGAQVPWESSSLTGDFYFAGVGAGTPAVASAGAAVLRVDPAAQDLTFWNSIKDSDQRADLEEYLAKYPNGEFAGIARRRLERMQTARSAGAPGESWHGTPRVQALEMARQLWAKIPVSDVGRAIVKCYHPAAHFIEASLEPPELGDEHGLFQSEGRAKYRRQLARAAEISFRLQIRATDGQQTLFRITPLSDPHRAHSKSDCALENWQKVKPKDKR